MISEQDQIVFEPAAAYRHYHTCMMYNILTGDVDPRHRAMNTACAEALDACQQRLSVVTQSVTFLPPTNRSCSLMDLPMLP